MVLIQSWCGFLIVSLRPRATYNDLLTVSSGFFPLTGSVTPSMSVLLEDSDQGKVPPVWF